LKRLILLTLALLLVSSTAIAQPPVGYIGLFIDESHTTSCVTGVGFYPVEMWIWCLPSYAGQICAEFMIAYPPNVIQSTTTPNTAIISVTLGDLPSGMSVCYISCQWDWHWPFHQLLYVTDPTPTEVNIVKHPDPSILCVQFANCEPGYPTECATVYTKLLINQECPPEDPISTEKVSWGAIKGLYKR